MQNLTVYRLFLTRADCYRAAARQTPTGVQVHSTGAQNPYLRRYVGPDDGQLGANRYGNHSNQPGSDVCASAYIGRLADGTVAVYQALPWDFRCWLSGRGPSGNANVAGYVGYEICEDGLEDAAYFSDVMEAAARLTAHLCELIGAMPDEKGPCGLVVMDHHELHAAGYASNHADVTHWLKRHGRTMDDFRARVREIMMEGISVDYVDTSRQDARPTLRIGSRGEDVRQLQERLEALGHALTPDGVYGPSTRAAVQSFQASEGLTPDGVCGPLTWAALSVADGGTEQEQEEGAADESGTDDAAWWAQAVERLAALHQEQEEILQEMQKRLEEPA